MKPALHAGHPAENVTSLLLAHWLVEVCLLVHGDMLQGGHMTTPLCAAAWALSNVLARLSFVVKLRHHCPSAVHAY